MLQGGMIYNNTKKKLYKTECCIFNTKRNPYKIEYYIFNIKKVPKKTEVVTSKQKIHPTNLKLYPQHEKRLYKAS